MKIRKNKAQFRGNPDCEKTNIAKNLRKIKVESHSTQLKAYFLLKIDISKITFFSSDGEVTFT